MQSEVFINVTSPLLPKLEVFKPLLEDIWERKLITNQGYYHNLLEKSQSEYLGVEHLNLFTNGTLPLITTLQALRISSEVITTSFSFVATTHSLWWNGIKPVFVDIDPDTGNINPADLYHKYYVDDIITFHHLQFGSIVCLDRCDYVYINYPKSITSSLASNERDIILALDLTVFCAIQIPAFAGLYYASNLGSLLASVN